MSLLTAVPPPSTVKDFLGELSEMNRALRLTGQIPSDLNAPPGCIPIQRVPADNLIQRC